MTVYVRTCQECGHRQINTPPANYKNDRWKDVKCRNCKSPALDYGSGNWTLKDGNLVRVEEDLK